MKELVCKNCNSNDLEYKGGIWVCNHCGSKYIPDKTEKTEEDKLEKMEERFVDLVNEWGDIDPWDDSQWDKRDKLERKWDRLGDKILEIEPNNPYVHMAYMLNQVNRGFGEQYKAWFFVRYAEITVDNAVGDEKDDLYSCVRWHLSRYRNKCIEVDPTLGEKIDKIIEKIDRE